MILFLILFVDHICSVTSFHFVLKNSVFLFLSHFAFLFHSFFSWQHPLVYTFTITFILVINFIINMNFPIFLSTAFNGISFIVNFYFYAYALSWCVCSWGSLFSPFWDATGIKHVRESFRLRWIPSKEITYLTKV